MLDKQRVFDAFRSALAELAEGIASGKTTMTALANRARAHYAAGLPPESQAPSLWTFRAYLLGARRNRDIAALAEGAGLRKSSKIDRARLMESFRKAVEEAKRSDERNLHPRTIAVNAHRRYCEGLSGNERRPALVTFTQRTAGRTADAEIMALIKEAGIENRGRVEIDRSRLLESFRECLKRLEGRIEKGLVRPIQVADLAHRLYVQSQAGLPAPSRLTFRGFVYERENHPELQEMLDRYFQT